MLWSQKPSDLSLLEVLGIEETASVEYAARTTAKQRGGMAIMSAITQKFNSAAAIDQMVSQVLGLLDEKAHEAEIEGWRSQAHNFEDVHPKEQLPPASVVMDLTQHVRRNPLPKERLRERLAEFETNPHALFELQRRLRAYRCATEVSRRAAARGRSSPHLPCGSANSRPVQEEIRAAALSLASSVTCTKGVGKCGHPRVLAAAQIAIAARANGEPLQSAPLPARRPQARTCVSNLCTPVAMHADARKLCHLSKSAGLARSKRINRGQRGWHEAFMPIAVQAAKQRRREHDLLRASAQALVLAQKEEGFANRMLMRRAKEESSRLQARQMRLLFMMSVGMRTESMIAMFHTIKQFKKLAQKFEARITRIQRLFRWHKSIRALNKKITARRVIHMYTYAFRPSPQAEPAWL